MSDPLVVNTSDGSCWVRRGVSSDGRGLYALEGTVAGAPDVVLVSLAELAVFGIAGMADVLPVPAGPVVSAVVGERETVLSFSTVPDGEHYAIVHHDYRTSHDLPETGGAS